MAIVLIYDDDLIIRTNDREETQAIISTSLLKSELKDLGRLNISLV